MVLHTTSVLVLYVWVHTQLWIYSQAHNSVHASTQCVCVHCQIYSQAHPPVALEERDQVKLGEGLVQRCSPLVGNHEKRVIAPRTSNAYKLSKSVQEVVRTCGVRTKVSKLLDWNLPSSRKIRVLCVVPSFIMRVTWKSRWRNLFKPLPSADPSYLIAILR